MNNIQLHNQKRVAHIYNSFAEASAKPLEKALTVDEFTQKYGAGFEVFSEKNISDFNLKLTETALEKGNTQDDISKAMSDEISTLEKVFVQDEKGVTKKFFVRKK